MRVADLLLPCVFAAACAPEPERDPGVVKDLRILGLRADLPERPLPVGAADADHPLYTFAAAPTPIAIEALVVDPRAPTAPLTFHGQACLAEHTRCDPDAPGTLALTADGPAPPEVLRLTFDPGLARLNDWVAEDPWKGFDRLSVRIEVFVHGLDGDEARADMVVAFYPPTVASRYDADEQSPRDAAYNPAQLLVARLPREDAFFNILAGGALVVPPGEVASFAAAESTETGRLQPRLNTDPDEPDESVLVIGSAALYLYTLRGRVSPQVIAGQIGETFDYLAPAAPADYPDTLWAVVRTIDGGCSWGRWTITPR